MFRTKCNSRIIQIDPFRCNICRKSYQHRGHLRGHMKAHRTRLKPIASFDEVSFKKRRGKYVCDLCSYTAVSKGHYKRHLQRNHLQPRPDLEYHNLMWHYALEKETVYKEMKNDMPSCSSAVSQQKSRQKNNGNQVLILGNVLVRAAEETNRQIADSSVNEEQVYHASEEVIIQDEGSDDVPLIHLKGNGMCVKYQYVVKISFLQATRK